MAMDGDRLWQLREKFEEGHGGSIHDPELHPRQPVTDAMMHVQSA